MGHPSYVQSLAFSNDGTTLAAGSAERTVWLWAAATGELRQVGGGEGGGFCLAERLFFRHGEEGILWGRDMGGGGVCGGE